MEKKERSGGGVLMKMLRSVPLSGSTMVAGPRAPRTTVESRDTVKLVNPFEDTFNNSVRLKTARMRHAQGIRPTQVLLLSCQPLRKSTGLQSDPDLTKPHFCCNTVTLSEDVVSLTSLHLTWTICCNVRRCDYCYSVKLFYYRVINYNFLSAF